MKKNLILLSLFVVAALCAARMPERPFLGDKRPARKIRISTDSFLKIKKGEPIEIIYPGNAHLSVKHAASELRRYLEKQVGAKVVFAKQPSGNKICFFLGISDHARAAGIKTDILCRDSFVIKRIGRQIYILGRDAWNNVLKTDSGERGTLFGVYDFLERFCGIHFYFYDDQYNHIPVVSELQIPEIDIFDRPDFEYRRLQIYEGLYGNEKTFQDKIPGRLRWNNLLRMQTKDVPNCHGLSVLNYIDRFGKSHPEYFSLLSNGKRHNDPTMSHPGQICFSSGIRKEIYLDAKACLTGQKAITRGIKSRYKGVDWPNRHQKGYLFNIMPQDGMIACRCASCAPIFQQKTEQAASNFIWQFVAEVGFRLKKENVPGYLSMMTYHYYRHVPQVELPDNIVVMFAIHGPWAMHTPNYKENYQRLLAWNRKLNDKVYLWTYVNKFGALQMPGIPHSTPEVIGKFYKSVRNDIYGAFLESETDFTIFNMLNYYVFSKIAWDKETDVDALLNDFYSNMFGKAAPHIRNFYRTLENKWLNQIAGRVIETPLGPSSVPPSDLDLWNKIYSADVLAKLDMELKAAARSVPANSIEAKHIALVRKDFYAPIVDSFKRYHAKNSILRGQKFYYTSVPGKEITLHPWRNKKDNKTRKTVKTQVQIWQTEHDFCVRFRCEEPDMNMMTAQKRKTDDREIWMDNCVEMFLNPSGDRKTYYQILVNSEGSFSDQKTLKTGASGYNDFSWNSGLTAVVKKEKSYWIADIRIPLKSLENIQREFPANFTRSRILKNAADHEIHYQSSVFARGFHDVENYGTIIFGKQPENLLINGDFSMPATRSKRHFGIWQNASWGGGWIAEKNKFRNNAVRDVKEQISVPGSIRLEGENAMLLQYLPKLKPNTKYRISYYVKLKDVQALKRNGGICANLFDDTNRWFPSHNFLTGTTEWIYQSFEFTTRKNTNKKVTSYLRLRLFNAKGTVWFDDVTLEEL